jgi:hypothetical protein
MEMRRPRPDEPELFAWWGALVRFAQLVHEEQIPWPLMIGKFSLVGHVIRAKGRDVWVYAHTRSKREVFVDADGQAYRLHPDRRTKARFMACSPRAVMYSAALPAVVDTVSYEPLVDVDQEPGEQAAKSGVAPSSSEAGLIDSTTETARCWPFWSVKDRHRLLLDRWSAWSSNELKRSNCSG